MSLSETAFIRLKWRSDWGGAHTARFWARVSGFVVCTEYRRNEPWGWEVRHADHGTLVGAGTAACVLDARDCVCRCLLSAGVRAS